MAAADATKFLMLVKKDARLRSKLKNVRKAGLVVKIGKQKGLDFTEEELHDQLKRAWAAKKMPSAQRAEAIMCVVITAIR